MFWHIAFISFKDNTDDITREEILNQGRELGAKCGGFDTGIVMWKVEKNLDLRKGVHLVQVSMFTDIQAFEDFRNHEAHKQFGAKLRDVADWTVGDFFDQS